MLDIIRSQAQPNADHGDRHKNRHQFAHCRPPWPIFDRQSRGSLLVVSLGQTVTARALAQETQGATRLRKVRASVSDGQAGWEIRGREPETVVAGQNGSGFRGRHRRPGRCERMHHPCPVKEQAALRNQAAVMSI